MRKDERRKMEETMTEKEKKQQVRRTQKDVGKKKG